MPKLEIVYLSSCNLTEFPAFLEVQDGVEELYLSNNKIKRNVREWLRRTRMETLSLLNLLKEMYMNGWVE